MNKTQFLQAALAISLLSTIASIVRIAYFPAQTPAAPAFKTNIIQQLKDQGWQSKRIKGAKRAQVFSQGDGYLFRSYEHHSVSISLIPVRVRAAQDLNAHRLNSLLSKDTAEDSKPLTLDDDSFRVTMTPDNNISLTGCIAAGAVQSSPNGFIPRRIGKGLTSSTLERLKVIIGLRTPRDLSCLFVKIRGEKASINLKELKKAWEVAGTTIKAGAKRDSYQKRK